jgi:biopolymer transport protein TolR
MASVGNTGGGKGGKKSLDAEINLVPFIDLLSVCICFLLMTAIWVEVGSIQMKQILGTDAPSVTKEAIDLQVRLKADKTMDVVLERGGRPLQSANIESDNGQLRLNRLGDIVSTLMNAVAGSEEAPNVTARVIPVQQVNYAELVSVLDIIRGYGVSNLAVVPVKE